MFIVKLTGTSNMAEETVLRIKTGILDLISDLDEAELKNIEAWISSKRYEKGTILNRQDFFSLIIFNKTFTFIVVKKHAFN